MSMKFNYWLLGFASAALLACAAWAVTSPKEETAIYGIPGHYVPVTSLRPASLEKVRLDIYLDFTCPHCQTLNREGIDRLKQIYGDRIAITSHYLATSDKAVAPMVLYIVGEKAGRAEEVAKALMAAGLARGPDSSTLEPVRAVAKQIGLLNEFNEAYADKSYRDKATAEFRAIGHKISFFPFVMIENQIGTSGEVRNLQSILDALLTKVPRQAAIHAPRTPSPMMPA